MNDAMLKFVTVGQTMPRKRSADVRRDDFNEIYDEFAEEKAGEQASRCSQCGIPYCQIHCPLQNNIPDWLMLTAEGRLEEAYEASSATNNIEICGRICPQDRLCEGNCVIEQAGHGTVTIGSVEKYITETAWERGWVKPVKSRRGSWRASVGIIGAGPAGLAAAEELRRRGYPGHGLRPLRPGRRPAGLRHPQLQAGKGQVVARAELIARGRRDLPAQLRGRPRRQPGGAAPAARRGADRDRRLQGPRHQGAGRRPGERIFRRSTT